MKGTFRGVVYGSFETGPSIPVVPVAVAVAVITFLSWLATHLLLLAAILGGAALLLGAPCWLLLRRNPRDAELIAERAPLVHAELTARLQAEAAARAVPAAIETHYHLHLPPGTDAGGIDWSALPLRDAATEQQERSPLNRQRKSR